MSAIKIKSHLDFERVAQAKGMKFEVHAASTLPTANESYSGTALFATHANLGNGNLHICQRNKANDAWIWVKFGDVTSFSDYLSAIQPLQTTQFGDNVAININLHSDHLAPLKQNFGVPEGGETAFVTIKENAVKERELSGSTTANKDNSAAAHNNLRAVDTEHIKNDAVTTRTILNDAIVTSKVASNQITKGKIEKVNKDKVLGVSAKGGGGPTTFDVEEITIDQILPATPTNNQSIPYSDAVKTYVDTQVGTVSLTAGPGITIVSKKVSADPDGTTIELVDPATDTSKFRVKQAGITANELAPDAVTTVKILDSNVTTDKIANDAVTADKLAQNSVITDKILNGNVTTEKIADVAVVEGKIATDAVTTAKILNGNVTFGKIDPNALILSTSFANPTGLSNASANVDDRVPTGKAVREYVDQVVNGLGTFQGAWNFQANGGNLPSNGGAGDYWYVDADHIYKPLVENIEFLAGDMIIAKGGTFGNPPINSNPSDISQWVFLKTKRGPATHTTYGLTKYATQAQLDGLNADPTSANGNLAVIGSTLRAKETAISNGKRVTFGVDVVRKHSVTIGNNIATSWPIAHGFATTDVHVTAYTWPVTESSGGEEVWVKTTRRLNTVILDFASAPPTDSIRVVISAQ